MTGPQIAPAMSGEWIDQAACAGHEEPDLWHPNPSGGMTAAKAASIRDAKAVCAGCPVASQCLQQALTDGYGGIWGGTTEAQRAGMRAIGAPTRRTRPSTPSTRCGSYSGAQRHRARLEQFCDACRDARNAYENDRKKRSRAARRQEMTA